VEARQDRRRVKELERELHRKDKALAETAALLVLSKTYGPPRLQDESEDGREGLRKRIRPHEPCSQPRWRSARPGPHKSFGIEAPFFEPG
jgi:hypothetical protein